MEMKDQRHLFRLPENICYLNTAYMSPQLREVEKVGIECLSKKDFPYEIRVEDFFEPVNELIRKFARLINAPDYRSIAIIPSVSYGMANVANNFHLQPNDEIIVVEEQFPSNVYPWLAVTKKSGARLVTVGAPSKKRERARKWNEAILEAP